MYVLARREYAVDAVDAVDASRDLDNQRDMLRVLGRRTRRVSSKGSDKGCIGREGIPAYMYVP